MKMNIRRSLCGLLAVLLMVCGMAVSAFADDITVSGTATDLKGSNSTLPFTKTVTIPTSWAKYENETYTWNPDDSSPPFTFTISLRSINDSSTIGGYTMATGVFKNNAESITATLNPNTYTGTPTYTTSTTSTGNDTLSIKYDLTFSTTNLGPSTAPANPTVYCYTVTETQAAQDFDKDSTSYNLYVYVGKDGSIGAITATEMVNGTETKVSSIAFNNTVTSDKETAIIGKSTAGTYANSGDSFAFSMTVSNTKVQGSGATYSIDYTNAKTSYSSPTDDQKSGTYGTKKTFNLQNGEYITVSALPGSTITVTETGKRPYKTSVYVFDGTALASVETDGTISGKDASVSRTDEGDDVTLSATSITPATTGDSKVIQFVNYADSPVITGVLLDLAPYLIVFALAAAGGIIFLITRRRRA